MTVAAPGISFEQEVQNLVQSHGASPLSRCIQCATCSAVCPAVWFMDRTPRELIALIRADMKQEVLDSTAYWTCASCFACTEACPEEIDPAHLMYALKRYSLWKDSFDKDLVGPDFSRRFARMIVRTGKSYEPGYAPAFLFEHGVAGVVQEAQMALKLLAKGRLPLIPSKLDRLDSFRRMIGRVIPVEGLE